MKKFESTLARIRCFDYGADWHKAIHIMYMTINTQTFLAEAVSAATLPCASAPVGSERRTDDAPALTGRYAS